MLSVREATITELGRWYSALETDFDERELLPLAAVRRAVKRGEQEFLLFEDEETGIPEGYALVCIRSVYGYVLLKYFGHRCIGHAAFAQALCRSAGNPRRTHCI